MFVQWGCAWFLCGGCTSIDPLFAVQVAVRSFCRCHSVDCTVKSDQRLHVVIFRPHKWGRKIMICDAFFSQILPKLHFTSTPLSALHFLLSQPVGRGFEPGLVLEIFRVSQPVGRGFEPGLVLELFRVSQPVGRGFDSLLRHTFFCKKSVAENIPMLSGRLV